MHLRHKRCECVQVGGKGKSMEKLVGGLKEDDIIRHNVFC